MCISTVITSYTTGVGSTVEFRELTHDKLQDFGFGVSKKKKLILMFPQDEEHPPPEEEPSASELMKAKKRRKRDVPYEEENIVQDWATRMLIK